MSQIFVGISLARFYCLNTNPPSLLTLLTFDLSGRIDNCIHIDTNCHFHQVIVDYLYLFLSFFLSSPHSLSLLTHALLLHCLLSRGGNKKRPARINEMTLGKHSSYVFLMYFEKPLNILKTTIKLH